MGLSAELAQKKHRQNGKRCKADPCGHQDALACAAPLRTIRPAGRSHMIRFTVHHFENLLCRALRGTLCEQNWRRLLCDAPHLMRRYDSTAGKSCKPLPAKFGRRAQIVKYHNLLNTRNVYKQPKNSICHSGNSSTSSFKQLPVMNFSLQKQAGILLSPAFQNAAKCRNNWKNCVKHVNFSCRMEQIGCKSCRRSSTPLRLTPPPAVL